MTHAIVIDETGGPDVLSWREVTDPVAGPGEIVVRHTAIGLNYIDTYFRTGLYPAPNGLPMTVGHEGAGVVEEVGEGVDFLLPGDRIAYAGALGAYAERRTLKAASAVKLPDEIDDRTAAAMMLKGMTARYLIKETFPVKAGQTVLFHAAAGGVGTIVGQWASALGVRLIGTVGSADKAELARQHGYDEIINYREEDFVARVKALTDGAGVDVVYDSVGQDTYPGSLDCLRIRGMWVSFGQSSGPIKNFELQHLAQRGSLFATRPTLFSYVETRARLEANAADLFAAVRDGLVTIKVGQTFALRDAAEAHRALEGRATTGSTLLIP